MSDQRQTQERTESSQREAFQQGQRAIRQAVEAPLEQTLQLQKNAAQIFLSGMEIGSEAQRRGIQLTREAMDTYFSNAAEAVESTEQLTETGVEAMRAGQGAIQEGVQSAQARAPRFEDQQAAGQPPRQPTQQGQQQRGQQSTRSRQQVPPQGQGGQPASQQQPTTGQYPETTRGYQETTEQYPASGEGYAQSGQQSQSATWTRPETSGYEAQRTEERPPASR